MLVSGSRVGAGEQACTPEEQRLAAVRELHKHEQQLAPAYKHWGYKNVFAKGFIGIRGVEPELPRERWQRLTLGEWHFAIDPELEHREVTAGEVSVLVLGHAFARANDSNAATDAPGTRGNTRPDAARAATSAPNSTVSSRRDEVAGNIAAAALADLAEGTARTRVDGLVTWLSGRFVIFVLRGDELDVYGDPMATRTCYYLDQGNIRVADTSTPQPNTADGPFDHTAPLPRPALPGSSATPERVRDLAPAVASHTELLSKYAGGLTFKEMRWALTHPDYADEFGRWMPGIITPHDHVRQVSANCRLTIASDDVAHRRFFPPRAYQRIEQDAAAAFPEFRDELRQQVRNWAQTHREVALPLTAGRDSRAILTAGIVELHEAGALTFTYHPFHVPKKSTHTDLDIAGRVSAAAGLPHLVIDVRNVRRGSPMDVLYNTTFPSYCRYANLAAALYVNVPARAATLFGVGGGIITGMYKNTEVQELSAGVLARKFTSSKFGEHPDLHARLEQWFAYTEFTSERVGSFSIYDLFHWEHRMSKWGAEGYLEYDLATVPAPVLNSRHLLLTALSLPEVDRKAKLLYDLLEQIDPASPPGAKENGVLSPEAEPQ